MINLYIQCRSKYIYRSKAKCRVTDYLGLASEGLTVFKLKIKVYGCIFFVYCMID